MMRSKTQEKFKLDLHTELQIKHKEFFESQLAIQLLRHPEYFNSAKKISLAIIQLMQRSKEKVIELI